MTIQFKKCKLEDVHVLREISIETFQDTYSKQNKPENRLAYLDRAFTPQQLERELVSRGSQFYLIYFDEDAAGYLKSEYKSLNWKGGRLCIFLNTIK